MYARLQVHLPVTVHKTPKSASASVWLTLGCVCAQPKAAKKPKSAASKTAVKKAPTKKVRPFTGYAKQVDGVLGVRYCRLLAGPESG